VREKRKKKTTKISLFRRRVPKTLKLPLPIQKQKKRITQTLLQAPAATHNRTFIFFEKNEQKHWEGGH
jgi:hypothetical protein